MIKILVKSLVNNLVRLIVLLLSQLFPFITEFDIIDFDPLFSDIHCRIQVSISCSESLHNIHKKNTPIKIVKSVCRKKCILMYSISSK